MGASAERLVIGRFNNVRNVCIRSRPAGRAEKWKIDEPCYKIKSHVHLLHNLITVQRSRGEMRQPYNILLGT